MKYTLEIVVDLPREEFLKKLDNEENMKHRQRGLVKYELLSQNPSQEGAQMSLTYKMEKREFDMIETIIKRDLPHEMHTTYDTKGVHNIQKTIFQRRKWKDKMDFRKRVPVFRIGNENNGFPYARGL